ncbi:MAG: hypothetical protein K1X67_13290 [Fimbriimonadaceae bacterium]|nr:hypothetical protein [Fimbriimonadaceae bacterium]
MIKIYRGEYLSAAELPLCEEQPKLALFEWLTKSRLFWYWLSWSNAELKEEPDWPPDTEDTFLPLGKHPERFRADLWFEGGGQDFHKDLLLLAFDSEQPCNFRKEDCQSHMAAFVSGGGAIQTQILWIEDQFRLAIWVREGGLLIDLIKQLNPQGAALEYVPFHRLQLPADAWLPRRQG